MKLQLRFICDEGCEERKQTDVLNTHYRLKPERIGSVPKRIVSVPERIVSVPERIISVPERIVSVPEPIVNVPEQGQG